MMDHHNAKDEFLEAINFLHDGPDAGNIQVKCAYVRYEGHFFNKRKEWFALKKGFTNLDFDIFLKSLDFLYDNGYGAQELFGCIWLTDGSWIDRREYDGSEWWERQVCPTIPKMLEQ